MGTKQKAKRIANVMMKMKVKKKLEKARAETKEKNGRKANAKNKTQSRKSDILTMYDIDNIIESCLRIPLVKNFNTLHVANFLKYKLA